MAPRNRTTQSAVSIAAYCLGVLFIILGLGKLWAPQMMDEQFTVWNYPPSFFYIVGAVEVLGGGLLITASARAVGAVLLGMVMIGSGVTHFVAQQWFAIAIPALIFAVLAWIAMRSPVRFVSPAEPGTPILNAEGASEDLRRGR